MALALLIPILAGGAAAQMTLPLINYDEVVKAINSNDPGYQICTAAAQFLSSCVAKAGGSEGLSTANPLSLAACACCIGTTDVAPIYSTCADYLGSEAPELGSQISAYDYLYTVCGGSPEVCRGQAGGSPTNSQPPASSPTPSQSSRFQSAAPSRSTPSPASSPSSIPQETSGGFTAEGSTGGPTKASATGGASGTSPGTGTNTATSLVTTLASACVQMVDIFQECTRATPGFTDMPFGEQAYCYCCRTALNGQITWTDEIETYASTCRNWGATAGPGEPVTAYDVAKTFATFCHHFSDVCSVSTTAPVDNTATNKDAGATTTTSGGQVTVTVTKGPATTTNAAATARVGLAAGVLAVAGFALMV